MKKTKEDIILDDLFKQSEESVCLDFEDILMSKIAELPPTEYKYSKPFNFAKFTFRLFASILLFLISILIFESNFSYKTDIIDPVSEHTLPFFSYLYQFLSFFEVLKEISILYPLILITIFILLTLDIYIRSIKRVHD